MRINIEEVKRTITQHPERINTIVDIAEEFHRSAETIRREFFRQEGVHLSEFIIIAKIGKMKELLLTTNLMCFEVCYQAGFRREDTGAKVFRRLTGQTMVQFRNGTNQPCKSESVRSAGNR